MPLIKCYECQGQISDKATACPRCGAPQSVPAVSPSEPKKDLSIFFQLQVLVVATAAGWHYQSWFVFGGVLLGLFVLVAIPVVGQIVGVLLAAAFGLIGYYLGNWSWGREAGYFFGIVWFLMGIGANFGAAEYFRSIAKEN